MTPSRTARLVSLGIVFLLLLLFAWLDVRFATPVARLLLAAVGVLAALWLLWRTLRAFLWKVGRRLAFSYFLLGVLPIPMVVLLLGVASYLIAGFFLGHLYRDAASGLLDQLEARAEARLIRLASGARPSPEEEDGIVFVEYRRDRRIGENERAPASWPEWLAEAAREGKWKAEERDDPVPAFLLPDGTLTLAAAAGDSRRGVLAFWGSDLGAELSGRSDIRVEFGKPDETAEGSPMQVNIGGYETVLKSLGQRGAEDPEAEAFFGARGGSADLFDRPLLWWGEVTALPVHLSDGSPAGQPIAVSLKTTPRLVARHLFSSSAEIDAFAWLGLFALASLLFWIYFAAALMAIFLIFGLSRAVNRLSRATERVQGGDFSSRIPVGRKDQVGQLQRSFNQMAANLERLVAAATQKELLEKELAIARDLQLSLVPRDLPAGNHVEFATLFEPSAAIGGDYFDILRVSEAKLAVVVADVSGHGLGSGLRMAMLKAALSVLVQKAEDPEEILIQLDRLVRSEEDSRFFVTAVLALLDLPTGELLLINAGHPPTYHLRQGEVEEILLPGSPLGGLGRDHGRRNFVLEPGDAVIWLSDGLIEATDSRGDPFGYPRTQRALAGTAETAAEVRDRLLAAVSRHLEGGRAQDDQTLVVMRYRG